MLFTSFGPGEGKTSTSLNMALCCSWTDKRILIVDADFRRCTLRNLSLTNLMRGLLDYLKKSLIHTLVNSYQKEAAINKLDYLPAGITDEYVTELIDGKRMEDLLIQLQRDV